MTHPNYKSINRLLFCPSLLATPGESSPVRPVQAAISHGATRYWAAAHDLTIEPEIVYQIFKFPEPTFSYAGRIFVRLDIIVAVCPHDPLARRAEEVARNAKHFLGYLMYEPRSSFWDECVPNAAL